MLTLIPVATENSRALLSHQSASVEHRMLSCCACATGIAKSTRTAQRAKQKRFHSGSGTKVARSITRAVAAPMTPGAPGSSVCRSGSRCRSAWSASPPDAAWRSARHERNRRQARAGRACPEPRRRQAPPVAGMKVSTPLSGNRSAGWAATSPMNEVRQRHRRCARRPA